MGNVGELDPDVLREVKWGAEVEVFNAEAPECGALLGEDAVNQELGKFKGYHVVTCVPRLADVIVSNCDLGLTGVFFLWVHLSENGGVRDLLMLFMWDVVKQDDMEGVSTHYLLDLAIWFNFHSLEKSPNLIE